MAVPVSDVPTLFLSGQLDLTTPPFEVDASMRRLRNSQHVVFPLLGHWVLLRDLECAGAIVGNFFDNPSARVDARCVAAMPTTAWAER
jgi:pimeloyl-ACP methyl ester carboxylesterase